MSHRLRPRAVVVLLLLLLLIFSVAVTVAYGKPRRPKKDEQVRWEDYELICEVNFPTGFDFAGTEVGGLSSITYDRNRGVYYSISDDQGTIDPVRYYTLDIDVSDDPVNPCDITFEDVTTILDKNGKPYEPGSLDPEGLVLTHQGQLYYTSEGFASRTPPVDPFVKRMNLNGHETRSLVIPDKYFPDEAGTQGVRNNLAFESLNVTPNQRYLWTAVEGALVQDGPAADLDQESYARMLRYRLSSGRPGAEYVYVVDPVADEPIPSDSFRVNGLVELLPLDNFGTMLAMERSFSVGAGNTVVLYQIKTQRATDVSHYFSLVNPVVHFNPVEKEFLLDVEDDLGIEPDNLEGMAFGPLLPDGRLPLVLVSDNNFNPSSVTQFIVLAVELSSN